MGNRITLLDLAKLNGSQAVVGLIEEVQEVCPEIKTFPARTIKGTTFRTVIRTGRPTVGFRKVNQGLTSSKSKFANKLVECFILGGRLEVDKAAADGNEDGAESLKAIEALGIAEESFLAMARQIYYGTDADAGGFPGLEAIVDDDLLVDAQGTTVNGGTSVYAVRFGEKDVELVFGNNTTIDLGAWREESISQADDPNKKFPGYVADLSGWAGLKCVNKYAAGRICNLTAQTGNGLTDALVAKLLSKWRGAPPHALFGNRDARLQLQTSRSVTIMSGTGGKPDGATGNFAPLPTESNGIPFICTDALVSTEEIVA